MASVKSKVGLKLNLNNGTKEGAVQTVAVSMGKMNPERFNDDKAMNIVDKMQAVLSKDIYNTQKTEVFDVDTSNG